MHDNMYFTQANEIYMLIIAVLIGIIFLYGHILAGFILLGIYALLIIYNVRNIRQKKDQWRKFIENFSSKIDTATRDTLIKLPFPLILIGINGDILWYNHKFSTILNKTDILGISVNDLIQEFNVKESFEGNKNYYKNIKFNDQYYDIYTNTIDVSGKKSQKEKIVLLYFNNVSRVAELEKRIDEDRECIMLLEVDNLDEVLKTVEDDKKPLLTAEVERTINSYGQNLSAALMKYSSSKYMISVQNKYIQNEVDKKFDILDTVREINIGNKLAVTLSIGIGSGGSTPIQNYNLASAAKELALGRGGDQVVLKNGEKLSFFGGNTKEMEKRTRVRARVVAHALVGLINESSNVIIMGHLNPDVDCLGAAIGICSAVRNLKKDCYIILDSNGNGIKNLVKKFNCDPEYDNVFVDNNYCDKIKNEKSLLVVVDAHSKSYIQNKEMLNSIERIVIVDHHRKSTDFIEGALLSYIEPYASSTSELVTEMLEYMFENPKLKPMEAEALLAGICIDTKNFCFKTGVRTFEAASFLRRLGADTIEIKKLFSDDFSTYIKRYEIIKSAKVENNIAIAVCPQEIKADNILIAQAADELLNITGIQASFVIVKIDKEIFISGRSFGDINVQLILESLGGGGHMTMAGARLKLDTELEAVEKLKNAINKYLMEGEK